MKFTPSDGHLTITLQGMEQLWALKRRLELSRDAIEDVEFVEGLPALQDFRGFLRFPGTAWPWLFLAGSYLRHGEREFWYIHLRQPGLLVITLKTGALQYDRIRLTCTPEVAQDIADWWQQKK